VQLFVGTWYHKFNDFWHMVPNANGAYCAPGQQTCFAPEWTTVNYLQKQFSKKDYVSIRNEFLDDAKGHRTGFKTWQIPERGGVFCSA
jgi:hypothetical protein